MTKCPRCNSNAKLTGKKWKYGLFHVKQYECLGCEKKFMEYYRNGKFSHTIPKDTASLPYPVRITRRITSYLKKHKCVSFDQIIEDLQLNDDEVMAVLIKLELAGLVEIIEDST